MEHVRLGFDNMKADLCVFDGCSVDARIANRQRKCPTCAIPFGKADVSTIYF